LGASLPEDMYCLPSFAGFIFAAILPTLPALLSPGEISIPDGGPTRAVPTVYMVARGVNRVTVPIAIARACGSKSATCSGLNQPASKEPHIQHKWHRAASPNISISRLSIMDRGRVRVSCQRRLAALRGPWFAAECRGPSRFGQLLRFGQSARR
jgi:hypothetical protein